MQQRGLADSGLARHERDPALSARYHGRQRLGQRLKLPRSLEQARFACPSSRFPHKDD
jgi:hypothetical protein